MAPDNQGTLWPNCWRCSKTFRGTTRLVVPISYSSSGKLTALIAQAKDEPERYWTRLGLASLLYSFLSSHRSCLEAHARGPFDVATVVPSHSSKRDGRDHLKELVRATTGDWNGIPWNLDLLTKLKPSIADDRRGTIDEDLFAVSQPAPNLAGRRVLLVDDLYTSGGTIASAAATLTAAGADPPVVVTIGRHLDVNEEVVREFARSHLDSRGYEPETCAAHTQPGMFSRSW